MKEKKRIVFFTKYSSDMPVSRCRSYGMKRALEEKGFVCRYCPLYASAGSERWYATGREANALTSFFAVLKRMMQLLFIGDNEVTVVEYPLLPGASYGLQKWLLRKQKRVVTDLVYIPTEQVKQDGNLRSFLSTSQVVITADAATGRGLLTIANEIIQLPLCVDVKEYALQSPATLPAEEKNGFRIGWIGTPATSHHLLIIRDCMRQLHELYRIQLVLIGFDKKREKELQGLPYTIYEREMKTEIPVLKTCDVGVLPLSEDIEATTSLYPMIQYMACRLPVVASSNEVTIAANRGNDNLFVRTPFEWYSCLAAMIQNKEYYKEVGEKNVLTAGAFYSAEKTQMDYLSLLESIAQS